MFLPLHTHSEYSFCAGVPKIPALIGRAKAFGFPALALTDTNRMSGLIEFYLTCLDQGIKPILGVELTSPRTPNDYVVILAKNKEGYADLCEMVTARHLDTAAFSFETAFAKPLPHLFLIARSPEVLRTLARTPNRDNLHAELIHHGPASFELNRRVEAEAQTLGLPLVVTPDSYFLDPGDWHVHRILRAIDLNTSLSRLNETETAPRQALFRSGPEMCRRFPRHLEALLNTVKIAEQCKADLILDEWQMPHFTPPPGHTSATYLRELAAEGLHRNFEGTPRWEEARALQEKELTVIEKLGYAGYFLIVRQIQHWAATELKGGYRRASDATLMRGSGANSLTFYNIGASGLDPLRHKLYFERFLHEHRASPPDADLDFGWDERDKVFDYIFKTFGEENVAVMATLHRFRERAAFRETAKVFGLSDAQISTLTARPLSLDDPDMKRIFSWSEKIKGKPHFLSQHPGGVLITPKPIRRYVALERSGGTKNRVITQIDMHGGTDELGLIKFDILGNGSLSVFRDALAQLEEQGIPDPGAWSEEKTQNDPAVWEMIAKGRTRGIFYIESPAQIKLNRKAEAATFQEIGITSSLIRPAGTPYAKVFVERHRKQKMEVTDWEFLHPALKPLLTETHDCLVFQEDVIRICREVAGLPFKRADRVRKMMNSLHEGKPADYGQVALEFLKGCVDHSGLTPPQALELWTRVSSFTGFSFCKSHSLSYAVLSFKCAYLKHRYPAQFMAAVVSNNHGFYDTHVYLNEARRLGVKVAPLQVNYSRYKYVGEGRAIVAGLMHVKGVRREALKAMVEERERHGLFRDFYDFLKRSPLHKSETARLIQAGGFDGWGLTGPELFAVLDGWKGGRGREAPDLFGHAGFQPPSLPEYSFTQRCLNEHATLGFMLSADMLQILDLHPAAGQAVATCDLHHHANERVKLFGMPIHQRAHLIPGKGEMRFISLEDRTGPADVLFWPRVFERHLETLLKPGPYLVTGRVDEEWGTHSLIADSVEAVEWSPAQIDFARAGERLKQSYPANYVYPDLAPREGLAA